jgi:hypothetical protein
VSDRHSPVDDGGDSHDGALTERTASFVLRLRLDEELLSGSIEAEGDGQAPISFRGWIGFMSAINGLRLSIAERGSVNDS